MTTLKRFVALYSLLTCFCQPLAADSFVKSYTLIGADALVGNVLRSDLKSRFLKTTDKEWDELNMPLLLNAVRRTKSKTGAIAFEALLQPIYSSKVLVKRQHIVRALLEESRFTRLDNLLAQFATQDEDVWLHLLDQEAQSDLTAAMPDPYQALFSNVGLRPLLVMHFMSLAMMAQGFGIEARHIALDWGALRNPGLGGMRRAWLGFNMIGQVTGLGMGGYFVFSSSRQLLAKIPQADHFVLMVGKALDRMRNLYTLIQDVPEFKASSFYSNLDHFWNEIYPKYSSTFDAVQNRLQAEKVGGLVKYWSMVDSLSNYDALRRQSSIGNILIAVGANLDAYLSIARLIREYKEKDLPMSFAEFVDGETPAFSFEGLVNPLVPNSVPNDFQMGHERGKHMVVTGPHACGKTTSQKSIAYAHILGQSLGILPAKKASFVPINKLKTYFNIGDKIGEGLSSFMSEHRRMVELNDAARNLGSDDRLLMLIDEPYAKTIQLIGEPRVTRFIRDLSTMPHLMMIVATHFEKPSTLEEETKGLVKNYQPEVEGLESYEFHPTYRMIEGAAKWWFENVATREAFIDWLVAK